MIVFELLLFSSYSYIFFSKCRTENIPKLQVTSYTFVHKNPHPHLSHIIPILAIPTLQFAPF